MKNLKVWQKLAVSGGVFMLPFAVVIYATTSSINSLGTGFARQEIRGLDYYSQLLKLLQDVQQHREMAVTSLGGDRSLEGRLGAKTEDIDNDITAIEKVDRRLDGALHLSKRWASLSAAARSLLPKSQGLSAEQSFEQHTKVIADTIALIGAVGDASNLTLDPDIDSYYLMNILVFQTPALSESLAQARGLGGVVMAGRNGTAEQFRKLNRVSVLVGFLQEKVDESAAKALHFNGSLTAAIDPSAHTSSARVREAGAFVDRLVPDHAVTTDPADYHSSLTRGIDSIFEMDGHITESLQGLLDTRIAKFDRALMATLGWAATGLLVVTVMGFVIVRDITIRLGRMAAIAHRIADGDLTFEAGSELRRDEIGALALAFERMAGGLKDTVAVAERVAAGDLSVTVTKRSEHDAMGTALANMVERLSMLMGEIQRSGIQLNTSVIDIAATSRQQQSTATEIAATATEIGATSKEISATSRELVRTMAEVSTVAEQTATLAGGGQQGVTRMEATMRQVMAAAGTINAKLAVLNEKASNINQVVTTITKVADQTNLLSLNAAIEAEKAGEYGRGFGVVATEIRRLADQTAVATYDIEQMVKEIQSAVSAGVMSMDRFSDEVRRGMQEVQQVGWQLSEIIEQVQALAPRLEAVNEGMQAQSTGAEQITQALAQLSEAAQQTVESLRQSSLVIDGLNQAATGMRNGVSRFKAAA